MSRFLLVGINAKYIHSNLAIRTLKANTKEYEKYVEIAEYTINNQREDILASIYNKKPEVIGFSCYLWNIEYVKSVASDIKKIMPDVTIIAGGPEVSYSPEKVLGECDYFDIIMTGEGENIFYEYVKSVVDAGDTGRTRDKARLEDTGQILPDEVAGIVYRHENRICHKAPGEAVDMDKLIFPYTDEDMQELEHRIIYYESMRGCPFSCSYCLSSIDKTVRFKSPEKTEAELDFFLRHKVPQVKFVDRTFNCRHDYAYRIWKYIGEHDNGVTNFHFEISGDLLREEDFELFAGFRRGLVQFEIGVQSTNSNTISAIRRTMDLDRLKCNVARVRSFRNIHQHLDLIAGLPYEDYGSFRTSFNDVYAMKPDQLQVGFLKVLDGSHMYDSKEDYGVRYSSRPPYEVLATKWLSYDDIIRLKHLEEMVEIYYNTLQFQACMAYLERFFETPFDMYTELADYYSKSGIAECNHSRINRYRILYDFVNDLVKPEKSDEYDASVFEEIITYDFYKRDYVKNPPDFVMQVSENDKKVIRNFYEAECEKSHFIIGYEGYNARQLHNMLYINAFTVDFEALLESGEIRRNKPVYRLFDYGKRNPLDYSAEVTVIIMDKD